MGKNEHPGKVIRGTDIEDIKAGRFSEVPLRYHTDNDIKKRTLKAYDLPVSGRAIAGTHIDADYCPCQSCKRG